MSIAREIKWRTLNRKCRYFHRYIIRPSITRQLVSPIINCKLTTNYQCSHLSHPRHSAVHFFFASRVSLQRPRGSKLMHAGNRARYSVLFPTTFGAKQQVRQRQCSPVISELINSFRLTRLKNVIATKLFSLFQGKLFGVFCIKKCLPVPKITL